MTGAILFGYAFVLLTVGARALRQSTWTSTAPRLGLATWQALTISAATAMVLGGLSWALPLTELAEGLPAMFSACAAEMRRQYTTPVGALTGVTGALVAAATCSRTLTCLVSEFRTSAGIRRRHRNALPLIARWDPDLEALTVPYPRSAAYCVPGRSRGYIVVTTAARERLEPNELAAVLAHERAHLAGRHHVLVGVAAALARAFPFLAAFDHAREACARLVELAADDQAARRINRVSVASAVLALGDSAAPAATLGAGGSTASFRAHRMLAPARRLAACQIAAAAGATAAVLVLPVFIAVTPAMAQSGDDYCPPPLSIGLRA